MPDLREHIATRIEALRPPYYTVGNWPHGFRKAVQEAAELARTTPGTDTTTARIAELDHLLTTVVPNLPGSVPAVRAILEQRRAELIREHLEAS